MLIWGGARPNFRSKQSRKKKKKRSAPSFPDSVSGSAYGLNAMARLATLFQRSDRHSTVGPKDTVGTRRYSSRVGNVRRRGCRE